VEWVASGIDGCATDQRVAILETMFPPGRDGVENAARRADDTRVDAVAGGRTIVARVG
jgi:hypothetical protein